MKSIPPDIASRFNSAPNKFRISVCVALSLQKWLRYYWDFCLKYSYDPTSREHFTISSKAEVQKAIQTKFGKASKAIEIFFNFMQSWRIGANTTD